MVGVATAFAPSMGTRAVVTRPVGNWLPQGRTAAEMLPSSSAAPTATSPAATLSAQSGTVIPLRRRADATDTSGRADDGGRPYVPRHGASAADAAHTSTETAASTRAETASPAGMPLSSVRSLRVMRSAAIDLRPANSVPSLPAAGGRMPALPGLAARRPNHGTADQATVVRRLVGPPAAPEAPSSTPSAQATSSTTAAEVIASPGARLAALSMPDQLTLRRAPRYAATRTLGSLPAGESVTGLGSSFAPDQPIAPATMAGTAAGQVATSSPSSSAPGRRSAAPDTSARTSPGATPAGPTSVPISPLPAQTPFRAEPPVPPVAAGLTRSTAGGTPVATVAPHGPAAPPVAAASTFRGAGTTNDAAYVALRRSLTTAPPRISIRPAAAAGPGGGTPATTQPEETIRRTTSAPDAARSSLLARAADMIRTFNGEPTSGATGAAGTFQGGPVSDIMRSGVSGMSSPIRRAMDDAQPQATDPYAHFHEAQRKAEDEAALVDRVADKVIERIEQRVIDELERRGRRAHPGGF